MPSPYRKAAQHYNKFEHDLLILTNTMDEGVKVSIDDIKWKERDLYGEGECFAILHDSDGRICKNYLCLEDMFYEMLNKNARFYTYPNGMMSAMCDGAIYILVRVGLKGYNAHRMRQLSSRFDNRGSQDAYLLREAILDGAIEPMGDITHLWLKAEIEIEERLRLEDRIDESNTSDQTARSRNGE